jgi:hypothetical protein
MLNSQNLDSIKKIAPFRNEKLFQDFLPRGYAMTTLSEVENAEKVIELKVLLGTLITLYDDFADRPDHFNPKLLALLYKVPFEKVPVEEFLLSQFEKDSLSISEKLFRELYLGMMELPHYNELIKLFQFDLKQFFLANEYCEILTEIPGLANRRENKLYLHHNMGIVMAGMIDLMSIKAFDIGELGKIRSLLLLGQRAGRISNIITTHEREFIEGDNTNELLISELTQNDFEREFDGLSKEMNSIKIKSFDVIKYQEGIRNLHNLHVSFKGVI